LLTRRQPPQSGGLPRRKIAFPLKRKIGARKNKKMNRQFFCSAPRWRAGGGKFARMARHSSPQPPPAEPSSLKDLFLAEIL